MKFILFLLGLYILYRYILRPTNTISTPQEPDLFIDHEEVTRDHEKNK